MTLELHRTKFHEIGLEKTRIYSIDCSFAAFASNSIVKFRFLENPTAEKIVKVVLKFFLNFVLENVASFKCQKLS